MRRALIVIDVQNHYINDGTKDLPEKIAQFIESKSFDFVLFTRFVNNDNSSLSRYLNWKKMQSSPDIDLHKAIVKYVKPKYVFEKSTYSRGRGVFTLPSPMI